MEAVQEDFYTTKAGKKVMMVKLTNGEVFLDWKGRVKDAPKVGQKVRIAYKDWTPSYIQLKTHHVIEKLEIIEDAVTTETFAEMKSSLRRMEQMLTKLIETTAKRG